MSGRERPRRFEEYTRSEVEREDEDNSRCELAFIKESGDDASISSSKSRSIASWANASTGSSISSIASRSPVFTRLPTTRSPALPPLPTTHSSRVGKVPANFQPRASTSSINSREYILDLADPNRPNASPSHQSARVQKHPTNFQCHLCPKIFTRAYILRSHLRRHTEESPFVYNVYSKIFARQHDRKRHEGLHSGEERFVCKGDLHSAPGTSWGCGRRFVNIDNLGRHFRSLAGQACLKPLLDTAGVPKNDAERQNFPSLLLARYPELRNVAFHQDHDESVDSDNEEVRLQTESSTKQPATGEISVPNGQYIPQIGTSGMMGTKSNPVIESETRITMIQAEPDIAPNPPTIKTSASAPISSPWFIKTSYKPEHIRTHSMDPSYAYGSLERPLDCISPTAALCAIKPQHCDPGLKRNSYTGRSASSPEQTQQPPSLVAQATYPLPQKLGLEEQQLMRLQNGWPAPLQDYIASWTEGLDPVITQEEPAAISVSSTSATCVAPSDEDLHLTRLEADSIRANVSNAGIVNDLRDISLSRPFRDHKRQRSEHNSISSIGEMSFIGSIGSDEAMDLWERELPSDLRTLRGSLVQQLLVMYHETIIEGDLAEPLDCGDTSSTSQKTSANTSASGGATKSSATSLGKRARDDGEINSNSLQSPDHKKKRTHASLISLDGRLLACPFNKMDPSRFSEVNAEEKNYRGCSSCYLTTISRLKQHLYRVHKRPDHYCARCFKVFDSKALLDAHARSRLACEVQDPQFNEKMTYEQVVLIRRRAVGQDQAETWFAIFDILFPGIPRPLSAYADSVSPEVVQRVVDLWNRQARGRLLELVRSELGGRMLMDVEQQRILDSALESALAQLVSATSPVQDRSASQSSAASPEPNFSSPPHDGYVEQPPEAVIQGIHAPQIVWTSPTLENVRLPYETLGVPENQFAPPPSSQQELPGLNGFRDHYSDSHLMMEYTNYSLPDLSENDFWNNDIAEE